MDNATNKQDLARDHERYKQLVNSMIRGFLICIVVAIVGGYLVFRYWPAESFPVFLLNVPGLSALVLMFIPLFRRKKSGFRHGGQL
jgi:hypothetical protein